MAAPTWKDTIKPIIQQSVDRTPVSHLEEKDYSLAWHYRNAEPELVAVRLPELRDTLLSMTSNLELSVLDGNRVLEVKPVHVHKGRVVEHFLAQTNCDFVVVFGDDTTDEFMFQAVPKSGWSVKVGVGATVANYSLRSVSAVRQLLQDMAETRVG